jgi:hypothetical protein
MKLILIISWIALASCTALDERFMLDDLADLVVETDDGPLEAYKASGDDLQWAVLERARLMKKTAQTMSSYFESTDGGFLVHLNFSLSSDTLELLAVKAHRRI